MILLILWLWWLFYTRDLLNPPCPPPLYICLMRSASDHVIRQRATDFANNQLRPEGPLRRASIGRAISEFALATCGESRSEWSLSLGRKVFSTFSSITCHEWSQDRAQGRRATFPIAESAHDPFTTREFSFSSQVDMGDRWIVPTPIKLDRSVAVGQKRKAGAEPQHGLRRGGIDNRRQALGRVERTSRVMTLLIVRASRADEGSRLSVRHVAATSPGCDKRRQAAALP